jgi:signal transduction histidine kinase
MRWPIAKRTPIVSAALIGCGLAVCAWQAEEHRGFERSAKEALIKRGRDITSTLGVVLRSQRRYGLLVVKERIEPSLQALVQSEELESIAILAAAGGPLASAGRPMDLTAEQIQAGGVHWGSRTLTIMNLIDLGSGGTEDGSRASAAIVMTDDERRSMRASPSRRQPDAPSAGAEKPAGATKDSTTATAADAAARPSFGRPFWMTKEQYDSVIQQKGVHSLVISLSTDEMYQKVRSDLLQRLLVGLLAMGGGIISTFAWRNFGKNAELQLRLVKAGDMNANLKEMNLAAAGLAHETRNPLNLIRGLAQVIAMETQDRPKLREHASAITEEADRVTVQLNEFINYSKPREAHLAPVEVARVCADVARTLVLDTEERQVRLRLPDTPLLIRADEQLLRQALFNLLLNAVQAVAPGGQIEIALTAGDAREATLEVRDNGPGVPVGQREAIFKPYVTMKPKGVGLGLAIVQQIVSAHGWEIVCLENQPRGAVFRISHLRIATRLA